jgi:SAM-dependent methyltransferase
MTRQRQKFDRLAADYDRYRPRYPAELLRRIADMVGVRHGVHVIDLGAGTGIALEGILPLLGDDCRAEAVDLSPDMVTTGRAKLPGVTWTVGPAEPFLEEASDVDLIVAAQSLQWMDRPRVLAAARAALRPHGVLAIIQNNRNYRASGFLDAYESLLEELSPGYRRHYRDIDVAAELTEAFAGDRAAVGVATADWEMTMPAEGFAGMARSSTQAQRAIAAHRDAFLDRLRALTAEHAGDDDLLVVPYRSELFTARRPQDA